MLGSAAKEHILKFRRLANNGRCFFLVLSDLPREVIGF
jgi:hypothetical protein